MQRIAFKAITTADNDEQFIPVDVDIAQAAGTPVESERMHLLAYIPWETKFLSLIPKEYQAIFKAILPYLSGRTTNVHTAISLSYVPELIAAIDPGANAKITSLGVIFHDCGWSEVPTPMIADSLDYTGVIFTPSAAEAKRLHTVYGQELIPKLLAPFQLKMNLSNEQVIFIAAIARFHERPHEYSHGTNPPSELIIACEADRLWPFTHQNFWLDVVRKGVEPAAYLQNVATSVEGLFLTEAGRAIAWRLINERISEVATYEQFIAHNSGASGSFHHAKMAA